MTDRSAVRIRLSGKNSVLWSLYAIFFCLLAISTPVLADDVVSKRLEQLISERFSGIEVTTLTPSPVAGVYELVSGGQIYYISEDGNHLFNGALIDTRHRRDLTAARLGEIHLELINQIDEKDMLIYEPGTTAIAQMTIFTDTSCPYCSRLHAEIDDLLDSGVRVRYLMFPRAGLDSPTYKQLESVWCADNPHAAMTDAKAGRFVKPATCPNPIESHVTVAEAVGLRGTPLIYFDDGQMIPGYRSAKELINMVNARNNK